MFVRVSFPAVKTAGSYSVAPGGAFRRRVRRIVFATVSFCDMLFIKKYILDVKYLPLMEFWNYELTNYEVSRITYLCSR
jgi:hypothetical protein